MCEWYGEKKKKIHFPSLGDFFVDSCVPSLKKMFVKRKIHPWLWLILHQQSLSSSKRLFLGAGYVSASSELEVLVPAVRSGDHLEASCFTRAHWRSSNFDLTANLQEQIKNKRLVLEPTTVRHPRPEWPSPQAQTRTHNTGLCVVGYTQSGETAHWSSSP